MTLQETAELLAIAAVEFSTEVIDAPRVQLWATVLEPYAKADVMAALAAHLRDPERGRFMPRPADLIKHLSTPAASGTISPHSARLYMAYAEARRRFQTGEPAPELADLEVRLGVPGAARAGAPALELAAGNV